MPPNIEDTLTSTDVVVHEGSNVTLKCRASGSPTPSVKWKRDDNSKISITKDLSGKYILHTHTHIITSFQLPNTIDVVFCRNALLGGVYVDI